MFKRFLTLALALMLVLTAAVSAEGTASDLSDVDFAAMEGVVKYDEPVDIVFSRTISSTTQIDESNPLMKSYTENLWVDTFKEALNVNLS